MFEEGRRQTSASACVDVPEAQHPVRVADAVSQFALMGLQREKAAFQPAMPERPKIFDDIEANDGEQEKKMRELRKNLKAEAPVCDCGKRGRSK